VGTAKREGVIILLLLNFSPASELKSSTTVLQPRNYSSTGMTPACSQAFCPGLCTMRDVTWVPCIPHIFCLPRSMSEPHLLPWLCREAGE
jgi:hypothetical protein